MKKAPLSSTVLNELFASKKYFQIVKEWKNCDKENEMSAQKMLTASAFHLYSNKINYDEENESQKEILVIVLDCLSHLTQFNFVNEEAFEKALQSSYIISFHRLLKDSQFEILDSFLSRIRAFVKSFSKYNYTSSSCTSTSHTSNFIMNSLLFLSETNVDTVKKNILSLLKQYLLLASLFKFSESSKINSRVLGQKSAHLLSTLTRGFTEKTEDVEEFLTFLRSSIDSTELLKPFDLIQLILYNNHLNSNPNFECPENLCELGKNAIESSETSETLLRLLYNIGNKLLKGNYQNEGISFMKFGISVLSNQKGNPGNDSSLKTYFFSQKAFDYYFKVQNFDLALSVLLPSLIRDVDFKRESLTKMFMSLKEKKPSLSFSSVLQGFPKLIRLYSICEILLSRSLRQTQSHLQLMNDFESLDSFDDAMIYLERSYTDLSVSHLKTVERYCQELKGSQESLVRALRHFAFHAITHEAFKSSLTSSSSSSSRKTLSISLENEWMEHLEKSLKYFKRLDSTCNFEPWISFFDLLTHLRALSLYFTIFGRYGQAIETLIFAHHLLTSYSSSSFSKFEDLYTLESHLILDLLKLHGSNEQKNSQKLIARLSAPSSSSYSLSSTSSYLLIAAWTCFIEGKPEAVNSILEALICESECKEGKKSFSNTQIAEYKYLWSLNLFYYGSQYFKSSGGPLLLEGEAFRTLLSLVNRPLNLSDKGKLCESLFVLHLYLSVTRLRIKTYRAILAGKEMRLYVKLYLDKVQSWALVTRTMEAYLYFSDLDLLCDDSIESQIKLEAFKELLPSSLIKSSSSSSSSPTTFFTSFKVPRSFKETELSVPTNSCANGASPLLFRSSSSVIETPSTLSSCSLFSFLLPLYLALQGVTLSYDGDESLESFLSSIKTMDWITSTIPCSHGICRETKSDVNLNCFHWMIELAGQARNFSEIESLLVKYRKLDSELNKYQIPHFTHSLELNSKMIELTTKKKEKEKEEKEEKENYEQVLISSSLTPNVIIGRKGGSNAPKKKILPPPTALDLYDDKTRVLRKKEIFVGFPEKAIDEQDEPLVRKTRSMRIQDKSRKKLNRL